MEIEKLAEVLRFESADNDEMIAACTTFVAEHACTTVQRVYRGHIGRRKFKIKKDVEWAKQAEKTAVVMQAAYRYVFALTRKRSLSARACQREY